MAEELVLKYWGGEDNPEMHYGNYTLDQLTVMIAQAIVEAEKKVLQEVWDAVNANIVTGHLEGNGLDKTAERNGLIWATNIIMDFRLRAEETG